MMRVAWLSGLMVAAATQAAVTVVGDATTRHWRRDEAPPAGAGPINLAAARGETRGFQLLVRSDAPVSITNVTLSDLRGSRGGLIPGSAAVIYRQHQLLLEQGSFRNDNFVAGWYPDPLIPVKHPLTGQPLTGARFTALPFELPAGETHGFYVELQVPRDAPPVSYVGSVQIDTSAGPCVLPVMLEVWPVTLPETPALVTAFGSPADRLRGYYKQRAEKGLGAAPTDWAPVDHQIAELLSAHRFNASPPRMVAQAQPDGSYRVPDEEIAATRAFIDRYRVNAVQVSHPNTAVKDPVAEQDKLRRWLAAWDDAAKRLERPNVKLFVYLKDEPNDEEEYKYVQTWGRAVKGIGTALKMMVVEQTKTQNPEWGDLNGAVDIWCPLFPLHDQPTADERLAAGEEVWTYTALCQRDSTPWWQIDFPLLNYRVPAWQLWQCRMTGLLYWGGMSYWSQATDMWTDPKTLDRRKQNPKTLYNGEGSLLYPGDDVGYQGVAPSLRLKALRDGIQDYDLLRLAQAAGKGKEAEEIVRGVAESWFKWDPDPAAYEAARAKLAALLK